MQGFQMTEEPVEAQRSLGFNLDLGNSSGSRSYLGVSQWKNGLRPSGQEREYGNVVEGPPSQGVEKSPGGCNP